MTAETVELLRRMAEPGGTYLTPCTGDIARARSLKSRGFALSTGMGGPWRATDAGEKALAS